MTQLDIFAQKKKKIQGCIKDESLSFRVYSAVCSSVMRYIHLSLFQLTHVIIRRIHIYYANMNRESRKGTNVKYYDKTEVNWSHYSSELLNVARYNYVTDMFDPALIAESDFKSLRDIFPNIFPGNFSSPVVFRRPQD